MRVLAFAEDAEDAELAEELGKVRALQLQEMGFSRAQSEAAMRGRGTVRAALEAIFVGSGFEGASSDLDEADGCECECDSEADPSHSGDKKLADRDGESWFNHGLIGPFSDRF